MAEVPFLPYSEYAVLTAVKGRVAVEFRRVGFDLDELLSASRAAGPPDVERWARMWRR